MKKLLVLLIVLFSVSLLAACGGNEKVSDQGEPKETATKEQEPTQDELNEQLKAEAVEANFVELNGDNAEENKKVFTAGEVTIINKEGSMGEFTLSDGDGGMYTIVNVLGTEISEGDQVKVYGPFTGKDDLGFPTISATIIEKQ